MSVENWLPIPGFPGYEASDQGQIRSFRSGGCRVLSPKIDRDGYAVVHPSGSNPKFVHRLVMLAFVGPCPANMEVLHGPGGPGDNSLSNLRYGTHQENIGEAKTTKVKTYQVTELLSKGHSVPDAAKVLGISKAGIYYHLSKLPTLTPAPVAEAEPAEVAQ
jgi:hypothetical protein